MSRDSLAEDDRLTALLQRLHAQSSAQEGALASFLQSTGARSIVGSDRDLEVGRAFWRDKFVALDADKGRLCDAPSGLRLACEDASASFGRPDDAQQQTQRSGRYSQGLNAASQ